MHSNGSRGPSRSAEHGQIIVLFALMLVALLAMGGLLFTGAQTLVTRRSLQNAGDAAALAGANVLFNNHGCSTSATGPIVTAINDSVSQNLPGFNLANVHVSCPSKIDPVTGDELYKNYAVQVDLTGSAPGFFGAAGIAVSTTSVAVNGATGANGYSVALLDPYPWQQWKKSGGSVPGCPSFLFNGGATAYFEGDIIVDSACSLSDSTNGAMKIQNSAATMVMMNNRPINVVGDWSSGTDSHITDSFGNLLPPQKVAKGLSDPLVTVQKPCASGVTTDCANTANPLPAVTFNTYCKQDPCILSPGTYSTTGSKTLCAGSGCPVTTLLLRPGVYYLQGTGFSTSSSSGRIYAIPGASATCGGHLCTDSWAKTYYAQSDTIVGPQWASDCSLATSTCGVLIYNAPASTGKWSSNSSDGISIGAQGVVRLRGYNPAADTTVNGGAYGVFYKANYSNLVMWQAGQPAPSATVTQPAVNLGGGGTFVISGTVYAPGALVWDHGAPGGCGGCDSDETVQYICWDLTLSGNTNYHFAYRSQYFARPIGYGLVQ
jgi:hypothetical protein